jgi:hypothetical protein
MELVVSRFEVMFAEEDYKTRQWRHTDRGTKVDTI